MDTTTVKMLVKTDKVQPIFPDECVFCCGKSSGKKELNLEKLFNIGEYRTDLSDMFGLPWAGGKVRIQSFDIKVEGVPTPAVAKRNIYAEIKLTCQVPYCEAHLKLLEENEEESYSRENVIAFSGLAGAGFGFIVSYIMEEKAFYMAVIGGLIGLAGAWVYQKLFTKDNRKKLGYLKSSSLGRNIGSLGFRCNPIGPPQCKSDEVAEYAFLKSPSLEIECEFTNREYAQKFAKMNNAELMDAGT